MRTSNYVDNVNARLSAINLLVPAGGGIGGYAESGRTWHPFMRPVPIVLNFSQLRIASASPISMPKYPTMLSAALWREQGGERRVTRSHADKFDQ